jgi:hypothetical protein
MSRISCRSLIVLAALTVTASAHARTHHPGAPLAPGSHASAKGSAQTDMRAQCVEMARARWGTNSQDMQTPRDYAYHACMYDHGMPNP